MCVRIGREDLGCQTPTWLVSQEKAASTSFAQTCTIANPRGEDFAAFGSQASPAGTMGGRRLCWGETPACCRNQQKAHKPPCFQGQNEFPLPASFLGQVILALQKSETLFFCTSPRAGHPRMSLPGCNPSIL